MRIKSVRGTNQHAGKGKLIGAGWCEAHGFWNMTPLVDMNGFLMVQRIDTCPKCPTKKVKKD